MNDSPAHDGTAMRPCTRARTSLSLATAILAIALAAALQAEEPRQLNGTQAEKVMTLARSTSPYIVTGTYEIPPDSELIIEAETKLLFAKDAALNVRGTLLINGSESAPVELTGKASGSPEISDFSRNWWASTDTQTLKSKGDTANLRSIRDGRDKDAVAKREVILSNFLEREPENCGSRLSLAPSR